jgi:regulator of replication initiation timing
MTTEQTRRPTTHAENIRIIAARVSERLYPAEKRELEAAAAELERATNSAGRNTKFSDFIRNASPEEKQRVYEEVGRKAVERQNAMLAAPALPEEPSEPSIVSLFRIESGHDDLIGYIDALKSQIAALRHDIERHVKIAADLATENEALRERPFEFELREQLEAEKQARERAEGDAERWRDLEAIGRKYGRPEISNRFYWHIDMIDAARSETGEG